MKLSLALIVAAITGAVSTSVGQITANSKLGLQLLNKARQLEGENGEGGEGEGEGDGQAAAADYDFTWMEGYSLKFLGCLHVAQWNAAAEDDDDVRIQTKRYVRFRLCPQKKCSFKTAVGCTSAFGDYVVDMSTFVEYYIENQQEVIEEQCASRASSCGCEGGEGDGDGEGEGGGDRKLEEDCLYNCYYNSGYTQCIDQDDGDNFEVQDYAECAQYKYEGGDEEGGEGDQDRRRKLEENDGQYYIGPYCADSGGKVILGMFTDDTCTTFADNYGGKATFEAMTGSALPYSSTSIVDGQCYTALSTDDDGYSSVRESISDLYQVSGKCETNIYNYVDYPNENACNWIQGIIVTPIRSNGIVHAVYHGSLKAAMFIALFATSFVGLAFYVFYLRSMVAMKLAGEEGKRRKLGGERGDRKVKKRFSFGFSRFRKKKNRGGEALL